MRSHKLKSEKILGVKINFGLTTNDVLKIVKDDFLQDGKTHLVSTTNAEYIVDAQKHEDFRKIINNASLSLPDGVGAIYAKRYFEKISFHKKDVLFPAKALYEGLALGLRSIFTPSLVTGRVQGRRLVRDLCEMAANNDYTVFFLGGWMRDKWGHHLINHGNILIGILNTLLLFLSILFYLKF